MIFFKTCPRCSGDRSLEKDMYGWYIICLNCGFVTYPEVLVAGDKAVEVSKKNQWQWSESRERALIP